MTEGSLCAMGGLTPMPVQSAIRHFPEDFERAGNRAEWSTGMSVDQQSIWDPEVDFGTPAVRDADVPSYGHDRRPPGRRAGRYVGPAGRDRGRRDHPQALRDRLAQGVRLVPDVPGRGRGRQGRARVVHDAVRRRHGRQHPDRDGARAAPQRDGALPLRPPGGLRRLRPRQLRDAGAGRDGRLRRGPLRPARVARRRSPTRTRSTSPTPTSPSTRPRASSAPAACAPAPTSRAPSR